MKITALVPMKGNSERVPNKNLRSFNGKPLYHAIVSQLLASKHITHVIINTDSDKIKADVEQHFPTVIIANRPKEICGDFVSMNEIINHDMQNNPSDIYLQTHSTNPLLKSETIDKAIEAFLSNNMVGEDTNHGQGQHDSLFSVTRLQTRLYWKDGSAVNHNPLELIRTQDLPPVFEENSNFYIFTKTSFNNSGNKRIGLKPMMFEIDKLQALDIDEPQDFILAELLYKHQYNPTPINY